MLIALNIMVRIRENSNQAIEKMIFSEAIPAIIKRLMSRTFDVSILLVGIKTAILTLVTISLSTS